MPDEIQRACGICQHQGPHLTRRLQDQRFGSQIWFDYFQCSHCKCLQITEPPLDMRAYYPEAYYLDQADTPLYSGLAGRFARARDYAQLFGGDFWGRSAARFWPNLDLQAYLGGQPVQINSRILDMGAGRSVWLQKLRALGMPHLRGEDFWLAGAAKEKLFPLVQAELPEQERDDKWDLVLMHDALGHFRDQHYALDLAKRRLARQGRLILSLPILHASLWNTYAEYWSGLDAPRNFFIHSRQSLNTLLEATGWDILECQYHSSGIQLWVSKQLKAGNPAYDRQGRLLAAPPAQLKRCMKKAFWLDQLGLGDHLLLVLGCYA